MLGQLFHLILKWLSRIVSSGGRDTQSGSYPSQQSSSDNHPSKGKQSERVSKWFTYKEAVGSSTASQRGIDNTPTPNTLEDIKSSAKLLDGVRELLGTPILVNSWYRCPELNKAVGGSPTSDHMTGRSIDFVSPSFGNPYKICHKIVSSGIKFDQLIFETNSRGSQWVHIGFGTRMRGEVLTYSPKSGYRKGLWES